MYAIFATLITIASVLLIGVVLIQKSKGGGLAANVNNYNQFMGVRKTTDFIEKATWALAIFICVLSICSCLFTDTKYVQGAMPKLENLPVQQSQGTPMQNPDGAQKSAPATPQQAPAQPAKK